jgi:two-component system chemotaxis response regulator CheB
MVIDEKTMLIKLLDSEKECFVKPSADPLFRSIARAFGSYSMGVIMTGMGEDGSKGALHIQAAGGKLLVENPQTAIAPSMPRSAIKLLKRYKIYAPKDIGQAISDDAATLKMELELSKHPTK